MSIIWPLQVGSHRDFLNVGCGLQWWIVLTRRPAATYTLPDFTDYLSEPARVNLWKMKVFSLTKQSWVKNWNWAPIVNQTSLYGLCVHIFQLILLLLWNGVQPWEGKLWHRSYQPKPTSWSPWFSPGLAELSGPWPSDVQPAAWLWLPWRPHLQGQQVKTSLLHHLLLLKSLPPHNPLHHRWFCLWIHPLARVSQGQKHHSY